MLPIINAFDVVLVFLLLTFNIFRTFSRVSKVDFEQVIVCWINSYPIQNVALPSLMLNFEIFYSLFKLRKK